MPSNLGAQVRSARPSPGRASRAASGILIRVGGLLVVVVVLAIGATIWDLRRATLENAFISTDNLAIVLAAQTGRLVQAVDIVLRDVQERINALGVTTPEQFKRELRTQEMQEFLHSRADRLPQVDNIALVGADGLRVNYSLGWPAPAVSMSDRDYAQHFTAQDDPGLFISAPGVNRATHSLSLYMVRRVNGPHGEFLGMVLASIPTAGFAELYKSINLPASESLMLLRRDGTVLARHPDPVERAGAQMPIDFALVSAGGAWRRFLRIIRRIRHGDPARRRAAAAGLSAGDGCRPVQARGAGELAAGGDADRSWHGRRGDLPAAAAARARTAVQASCRSSRGCLAHATPN